MQSIINQKQSNMNNQKVTTVQAVIDRLSQTIRELPETSARRTWFFHRVNVLKARASRAWFLEDATQDGNDMFISDHFEVPISEVEQIIHQIITAK